MSRFYRTGTPTPPVFYFIFFTDVGLAQEEQKHNRHFRTTRRRQVPRSAQSRPSTRPRRVVRHDGQRWRSAGRGAFFPHSSPLVFPPSFVPDEQKKKKKTKPKPLLDQKCVTKEGKIALWETTVDRAARAPPSPQRHIETPLPFTDVFL